jgi:hypothetical protein
MPIGTSVSAFMGASSSRKAAQQSAGAIMYAARLQKEMYDADVARQEPFYQQGITSLADYAKMLKGGYDMKQSPAAQYELTQGTKTMNRQMAARGMLGGGTAATRLGELSGGVAARDWQNQYSRLLDSLKLGTGAAGQMGQSGQVFGGQAGQNAGMLANVYTNQGNNMAGIYQNWSNSMANAGATAAGIGVRRGWGGGSTGGQPGWSTR